MAQNVGPPSATIIDFAIRDPSPEGFGRGGGSRRGPIDPRVQSPRDWLTDLLDSHHVSAFGFWDVARQSIERAGIELLAPAMTDGKVV